MAELIKVKSGRNDCQVVLYEKHPDHPGEEGRPGEVFISNPDKVYTVAKTPMVLERLSWGWLVEVRTEKKSAKPAKKEVTDEAKKA
jgi:hypothetical protein